MTKTTSVIFLLLFTITAMAREPFRDQRFKVLSKGKAIGTIAMTDQNQNGNILLVNDSGGTAELPNGNKREFKSGARHILDSNWNWKSSEIIMPLSKEPVKVTIVGKKVQLNTAFRGIKSTRYFDFSGMILPRRAFYNYLRTLPPGPAMQPKEIYIFNEMNLTLYKATWMYLGPEKTGAGIIHKYEVRGLDTMIHFDDKMNILRVKELDVGLELVKN